MTTLERLSALCALRAASGAEEPVLDWLAEQLAPRAARLARDLGGNLLVECGGEGPTVLLTAHADQVALRVHGHLPGGFLALRAHAIDPRALLSAPVEVLGRAGTVGSVPTHLQRGDRTAPPEERDLYVDLGFSSEAEAAAFAPVGTPVYFRVPPRPLLGGRLSAPALDNRASVAALLCAFDRLASEPPSCRVVLGFTRHEETGRAGAAALAESLQPDLALVVDVTFAHQFGVDPTQTLRMGGGPAIGIGPNIATPMGDLLSAAARASGIAHQFEPLPGDSGTDGWVIQTASAGVLTGVVSIPITSMHSPAEVVELRDIDATGGLLAEAVARVAAEGVPRWR